jgi:lipopolysaccharide transport system permease protein
MSANNNSLLAYRGFIAGSVRREFEQRYRNSLLGGLWSLLTPLMTIVIYVVIFSNIMKARLEGVDNELAYGIYICSGVLAWGMFTEVITRSQSIFLDNANMLKKLSFPRICLPIIVVSSSLLNFSIVLVLFLIFLLIGGVFPGLPLFALFPLLLIQLIFAVGIGLFLGVVNVFFRDVGPLTAILLQFWFWSTPIVYPIDILPGYARQIVELNPMTALVMGYQNIFVYARWPEWQSLLMPAVLAVLICLLAAAIYRKRAGEMVDEL